MKKIIYGLVALVIALIATGPKSTKIDEGSLFKAEVISQLKDEHMPRMAIITDSAKAYERLTKLQSNKKVDIYLYNEVSKKTIKDTVLKEGPKAIYYLTGSSLIAQNIEDIFKDTVTMVNMKNVCIDTTLYNILDESK